ncbi:MAG: AMP-binding protein [Betaproteobacteria bacterium]
MNLAHLLLRTAARQPQHAAVVEPGRCHLSYAQLAQRTLALAGALRSRLGLTPGQRVALVMQNNAAYVELLLGCWAAQLAAIPVNVKLHPREVAWILDDAQAAVVFMTAQVESGAIAAARASGRSAFIDVDGTDYAALLQHAPLPAPPPAAAADLAWLFYTSGTTGRPKGVMLSHRNLLAMALNYLADVDAARPGEHLLHAAPMSHGSGLYIVPNVAAGATQLVPASRGFDAAEIDALLADTAGVKFFAAPTMVKRLVERLRGDARGLKQIVYGGGPMYVADSRRALARLGPRLVQIYGQGESPMTITVLRADEHLGEEPARSLRLGSVGRAQTGVEVAVVDENHRPVPAGEVGEVIVRGDTVMLGYLNNPAATASAIVDGWLRTGDLGRLDAQGYLTLVDRSKDLIISGGSNIYPREVEEALLQHPMVREVAVVGERDAAWGESVVAVVVLQPGAAPEAAAARAALDAHCLVTIARFKRPKRYVFVDSLPKNATGKVLKRELREGLGSGR